MKRLLFPLALLLAPLPVLADDAPEGGAWADCPVGEVTAYRDRIVIGCAGPAAKGVAGESAAPRRFAVESNDLLADNLVRLALEARARSRPLSILYVKSPAANPQGCDEETCRRAAGASLK